MRDIKGMNQKEMRCGEELRGEGRGETEIRIYYVRGKSIFNKRKIRAKEMEFNYCFTDLRLKSHFLKSMELIKTLTLLFIL